MLLNKCIIISNHYKLKFINKKINIFIDKFQTWSRNKFCICLLWFSQRSWRNLRMGFMTETFGESLFSSSRSLARSTFSANRSSKFEERAGGSPNEASSPLKCYRKFWWYNHTSNLREFYLILKKCFEFYFEEMFWIFFTRSRSDCQVSLLSCQSSLV